MKANTIEIMKKYRGITLLIVLSLISSPAFADIIYLKNGDRITGTIREETKDSYSVDTESLGTISLYKKHVSRIQKPAPDPEPKQWSIAISAGFDRRRGNTRDTELNAGLAVKRKRDNQTAKDEWDLNLDGYYSKNGQKMDGQKYSGMLRYAFSFGPGKKMWYNFYSGEGDHDRFANIDSRWTPTIGIGYWFSDQDPFKLMAELGGGVTYTDFRDETKSTTEGVLVPRAYSEIGLFGGLKLIEDFRAYPLITESGEYRIYSETTLEYSINNHLFLNLRLIDEYNSDPGIDIKKNDLRLTSDVTYKY